MPRFPVLRLAAALAVSAVTVRPAEAARLRATSALPSVSVLLPAEGAELYYELPDKVSDFYDPITETVRVTGGFGYVPIRAYKRGDWAVRVNGFRATLTPTSTQRVDGKRVVGGIWNIDLPVSDFALWPVRPIVAEIFHQKTNRVYDRDYHTLFDFRRDPDLVTTASVEGASVGAAIQLTDAGLGVVSSGPEAISGLETPYLSALPQPDLAGFNTTLTANARAIPHYDDDTNELKTCIDLNAVDEARLRDVTQFPPFASAMAEATTQFLTYQARDTICPALIEPVAIAACYAAANLVCVKSTPTASDFELCIDQIEGDVDSLVIDDVSDVALRFLDASSGTRARVESHVTLDGIHATIDGRLRSLYVRWKNGACAPRPRANLDDDTIPTIDWLDEWTTCNDMNLDYSSASTVPDDLPSLHNWVINGDDPATLGTSQGTPGVFTFSGVHKNVERGTCGQGFVEAHAADMLDVFKAHVRDTVGATWFPADDRPLQATAFEKLIAPFEIGTVDLPDDHEIVANFTGLFSEPVRGMRASWGIEVDTTDLATASSRRKTFFYHPHIGALSRDADTDWRGDQFDFAYAITTGFLNRILNVRAGGDALRFDLVPTWNELAPFGIAKPAGARGDAPVPLTGALMAAIDPAFAGLGARTTLRLAVDPMYDPIVFMTSDVPPEYELPVVNTPITYGIPALRVRLIADSIRVGRVVETDFELLEGVLSFADQEFKFNIDESPQAKYLVPVVSENDTWTLVVHDNLLPRCQPTLLNLLLPGSCEGTAISKLRDLLSARLRPIFVEFLSHVPAPQWFDARGDAATPVYFEQQSRYQIGQVITYYGQLEPAQ